MNVRRGIRTRRSWRKQAAARSDETERRGPGPGEDVCQTYRPACQTPVPTATHHNNLIMHPSATTSLSE